MKYKVSVVIVTWNNEKDIEECLNSVLDQDFDNYNVIVFDNASTDKTFEIVNDFKNKYTRLEVMSSPVNLYLTGGNNRAMQYAIDNFSPDYILCLNPDTYVEPNLLSSLLRVIESDSEIAAVGPKIKFWSNKNEGLINSVGLIYDGFMQAYDRGLMEEDKGQYDKTEEVFAVSGTCVLYRRLALDKVGLYYEPIKMYLDEVELAIRIRKAGYKIMYVPDTTVGHKYMQSTDQNKLLFVKKQQTKAWLLIALRHYPLKSKLAMIKKYLSFKFMGLIKQNKVTKSRQQFG